MTCKVFSTNWIISAIREHIGTDEPLPGACEAVGVDEAAEIGVVITALQVIEPRLLGMRLAGGRESNCTPT